MPAPKVSDPGHTKKKDRKRKTHSDDVPNIEDIPVRPPKKSKRNRQKAAAAIPEPAPGPTQAIPAADSTEDVLRVLQDLDPSKVAELLKSMGGDTTPVVPSLYTALQTPPPPAIASSSLISSQPNPDSSNFVPTYAGSSSSTTLHPPPPQPPRNDHTFILSHKWMSPSRLGLLAKTQGLVYKKGKFSAIEEQQIRVAIQNYRDKKGYNDAQIQDTIFPKDEKDKDNDFWFEATASVPLRPVIAVYHHVRRANHPLKHQGKWSDAEDKTLLSAMHEIGQHWENISLRVGRMASDCRDRYRNHLVDRDTRVSGAWSKEEEDQLVEIVTDMTVKQNKDWDNDVFWTKVSQLMDGKRGRQQCRIKWTDSLSKTVKTDGERVRWGQQDACTLVNKVEALNVHHDSEIDWKLLPDPTWNLWSAHILQRRWQTMKKGIKGHESMSHKDVMDILQTKKGTGSLPGPSTRKRKDRPESRVTSSSTIGEVEL